MYRDCKECGSQCCKFFGVPIEHLHKLHHEGVSLDLYRSALEPNPSIYFSYHEGIVIRDGHFVVSEEIPTREIKSRLGSYIIIYSKCQKLDNNGECSIYDNRPEMCRNFVASTASQYIVLRGCIFDHNGLGEVCLS